MGEAVAWDEVLGGVYSFVQSTPAPLKESNQLGAVRLDRDLRAVIGYLSNQTVFGNAREKFQRLQQMSTLLNLDLVGPLRSIYRHSLMSAQDEDVEDFYSGSGIAWKLTLNEAKNIAALRQ